MPWFFLIFAKKVTKGKQLTLFRFSQIDLHESKIKNLATKNNLALKSYKCEVKYCISWIWETLHNCESDNEKWGKNWMTLYEILCKQSSGKSNADLASKKLQQCVQSIFQIVFCTWFEFWSFWMWQFLCNSKNQPTNFEDLMVEITIQIHLMNGSSNYNNIIVLTYCEKNLF